EPACRALVVARELDPQCVWPLARAIQAACYTQARDVTQCQILIELAAQVGYNPPRFHRACIAAQAVTATAADFNWVADLGISGFPTLVAQRNGVLALLANGYQPAERILPLLQRWVEAGYENPPPGRGLLGLSGAGRAGPGGPSLRG